MDAYLNEVVRYVTAQSWQIAMLTAAIAAVTFALRHRSAHVRYLLWLIVLAKCLVPPLQAVPVRILPQMVPEAVPAVLAPPAWSAGHFSFSSPAPTGAPSPQRPGLAPPSTVTPPRADHLSISGWLGVAWIAGAGTYLLMNLLRALRGHHWLRKTRRPLPPDVEADTANLLRAYAVRRLPRIWIMEGVGQPFVWGLLRGNIYVPPGFLTIERPEHRRGILAHELSHIIRLDAAINLLQVITQAAFWFHPFVWWANRKTRQEREKCCDEMAIASLGAKPKDYSTAIVGTLVQAQEAAQAVPSLAVAGPVKNIEERIRTMLRPGKKFYRRPSLIASTTILLAAILTIPTALVLTVRAQTEAPRSQTQSSTPLHEAARTGDIEKVKALLSSGADVNAKDTSRLQTMGVTALHYAVLNGHRDIAELLVASGADLNAKDQGGDTPLLWAVLSKEEEIVKFLVAKGAQASAIHMAAYLGDVDKLQTLIDQGTDVDVRWAHDTTPLLFAIIGGQREAAKFLIDKGANVNAREVGGGMLLLQVAVGSGDDEMVKLLIDKGADVKAAEKSVVQVLLPLTQSMTTKLDSLEPGRDKAEAMRLWWESKRDMVKLVLAKGGHIPTEVVAVGASVGLKDLVELALNEGADVNARAPSREDKTLLHEAVESGQKELVQYLLDKGANIDAKEGQGLTPLHKASAAGSKEIVELLLARGAAVNVGDTRGATPLWYANKGGYKETVELLRSHGAEEQAPAISLHEAARDGDLARVQSLVSGGADVNAMDDRLAATPLHLAAYYARLDVVQFLISKGANVNATNRCNRTALDEAVDQNRGNIAQVLRAHGAKSGSSLEPNRPKPAKSLLESAAYKYAVPEKNLEIPESMQSCAANLQKIHAAIKKYEKDKGTLPNWLSDLVPNYVSKETLLCPHKPVNAGPLRQGRDPRLPCSYGYTFAADRRGLKETAPGVTRRDWKTAQVRLFGDVVPLVRCYIHGSLDTSIINLDVSGRIYLSPMSWEEMFMPGYYAQKEIETVKLLEGSAR